MSNGAKKQSPSARPKAKREVLSSLPHTRPQRPSARRAAARASQAKADVGSVSSSKKTVSAKKTASKGAKAASFDSARPKTSARPRATKKADRRSLAGTPPAPRQGFETETEIEMGLAVDPPTTAEMITSAIGLAGELAQVGVSTGGRLLKGALSRLPLR
jgi:hypothetical protein